ncbi:MAG: virulence-associated E family protein [Burkholderiales bacterium]|nr:virulence-associated E family protein [Burkholderiales bacterium]
MTYNFKSSLTFGAAVQPYLAAGWPRGAFLPGIPGTKRPGRYLEHMRDWVGLTGFGLLRNGLSSCKQPTTWDDIQCWPTSTICCRGSVVPALDIDSDAEIVHSVVRDLLRSHGCRVERRRDGSGRFLVPFRGAAPLTRWPPIRFYLPGDDPKAKAHAIELNAHGQQWVAGGMHPEKGAYWWHNEIVGRLPTGAVPRFDDLTSADDRWLDELRKKVVEMLEAIGAKIVENSKTARKGVGDVTRVDPNTIKPHLSTATLERVLEAIPNDREHVGGWDEIVELLAAVRAILGTDGKEPPDRLVEWIESFPEGTQDGFLDARWRSFDDGVSPHFGRFIKWVKKWAPERAIEVQKEVDRARGEAADQIFGIVEGDIEEPTIANSRAPASEDGGGMYNNVPNLTRTLDFLAARPEWRGVVGFCEFRGRVVLRRPVPRLDGRVQNDFVERSWSDHDDITALNWCQGKHLPKLAKSTLQDAIEALALENRFHPVRDYLNGLSWDGKPRLDTWLADLAAAESFEDGSVVDADTYIRATGRVALISAVARVYDPGCKVDTVLVLEGPQGVGKSRLIRALCPDPAWHGDDLPTDLAHKDAKEYLQGRWLIEIAELAQFKRTELAALKGFVSTSVDQFRRSYGRHTASAPRQSIFIATTNEDNYLPDDTGNRRFFPVRVGAAIDIGRVEQERDQLWAEAVTAYRSGEPWWIEDPAVVALVRVEQSHRQTGDPWDEPVRMHLTETKLDEVTIHELFSAVGIPSAARTRSDQMRLAGTLKRLGWTKHRSRKGAAHGQPRTVWRRPHRRR